MPTVRISEASEYPESAQRAFELSKTWFNYDIKEPSVMGKVQAWDPRIGGPHGRAMKRVMGDGEFSRGEKEMVAAVVNGVNACSY